MTSTLPALPNKQPRRGSASDKTLLSLDAAIQRALDIAEPVTDVEDQSLQHSIGRALAETVDATMHLPPFDAAAMDGYAIHVRRLSGDGPWTLPIVDCVLAGDQPGGMQSHGAVRIMTGAPMPAGFDTVVMQERVMRSEQSITIIERPKQGLNVRYKGEDARPGDRLLGQGREIGARELAALSAIGRTAISVRRRLRVVLICTGSELVQPGLPLGAGQIYNSNRYAMLADLSKPWIDLVDYGAIPDDAARLKSVLAEASENADAIITTGGMSVGDADYLPGLFKQLGGESAAIKVAMKPGKPLTIGRLGKAIFLGLPGNPVSVFTTFALIGSRTLRRRAGFNDSLPVRVQARVDFSLKRRPGRVEFRPASITGYAGAAPVLSIAEAGFSARISTLASASGFAVFPPGLAEINPGETCDFIPFSPMEPPR